jgi:hypothetical protein
VTLTSSDPGKTQKVARNLLLSTLAAGLCAFASPSHAQDASLLNRLAPTTGAFVTTTQVDLSRFSTASRTQTQTGSCVGFSHIAAIEARFVHKYCKPGTANAFRNAGYCTRYDFFDRTPFYVFSRYSGWMSDNYLQQHKELDLSEAYYLHRVFLQSATLPGSRRDTLTIYNFGDQMDPNGVVSAIPGLTLSEEAHSPYIDDAAFWAGTGAASIFAYMNPSNFEQSKIDRAEIAETPFISFLPGSMQNRVAMRLSARTNARFKVTDIYHGNLATVGTAAARITFLERLLFSGYEVGLHGAQPGHSMLLVGYDRKTRLFYFKDHYRRWVTVPYDTAANAATYTVALDVSYEPAPSREEMWIGVWELDIDGRVGELTLRRTRQALNTFYRSTPNNFTDRPLTELPRNKWARVGSYVQGASRYPVYGRLGTDNDDGTMELSIDWSRIEGPSSTLAEHQNGFTPSSQILAMTIHASGPGAGAYAVGETVFGNRRYGVTMRRNGHTELGTIPHVAISNFTRANWNANPLRLRFEDGTSATLYPNVPTSGAPTAWLQLSSGAWVFMNGWLTQDNEILFWTDSTLLPRASSMRLLMHTWERSVVSGLDASWRPVFGSN